ncbi:MAG: valine--tRNA ligase [Actinomycetes bacterium]|nr:valine--tRNA ligase [Actinomycetes bacterium]
MSTLDSRYDPKTIEADILASWLDSGAFAQAVPDETAAGVDALTPPYVITIPPPNVTGSLHMGHALNNTLQDVLIRKNRMTGRPTRWIVGTDHAGIATQNKVEQKLAREGKTRYDVGREAFIDACWEWRREHGGRIIGQLKAMGCSCDFDDEWFTMNESYQRAVREVFVDWYNKGLIYRGNRIINWCPRCTTALSDIEVEHEDKPGKLWHIRYPLVGARPDAGGFVSGADADPDHIVIATTRPETMLGDVAVAVHPDDERYADLIGSVVLLPLTNRAIPIIADPYVDPAFGTGAVKITPAHDANDFEVGQRHNLEQINILNPDATINEQGGVYAGLDRYAARAEILRDLQEGGYLAATDDHDHAVGVCYRCATEIEPWLSEQWFVDMKPLAAPAIAAVRDGRVRFHPARWADVYFHWMENIRDWCISRQLWWGHRIPVFYCDSCGWVSASIHDITTCPECGAAVRQDEDVLDTWFSSQLWPFATMGWPAGTADALPPAGTGELAGTETAQLPVVKVDGDKRNRELDYFYPTSALSTARDILFLWVARMIVSGLYFLDEVPFADVIIHPTVFNKEGKRMSKSLGTGIDPLDLMEDYGADGMRFGLMLQVTGVQDLKFDEDKLLSSRNFANKIWNAARFVLMNVDDIGLQVVPAICPKPVQLADRWILSRLAGLAGKVSDGIDGFEFGEVARLLYDFFWNEFCDWYIELAKARLNGSAEQRAEVQQVLLYTLDQSLRLLHPIMPFITEEIWRKLPLDRSADGAMLLRAAWPDTEALAAAWDDPDAERRIELLKAVVSGVRNPRSRYGLSPKEPLTAVVKVAAADDEAVLCELAEQIKALATVSRLTVGRDSSRPSHAAVTVAAGLEIYVPLEGLVDFATEAKRLTKTRDKQATDLAKLEKKLSNPGFLEKAAPEVIEKDRARAAELAEAVSALDVQLQEIS